MTAEKVMIWHLVKQSSSSSSMLSSSKRGIRQAQGGSVAERQRSTPFIVFHHKCVYSDEPFLLKVQVPLDTVNRRLHLIYCLWLSVVLFEWSSFFLLYFWLYFTSFSYSLVCCSFIFVFHSGFPGFLPYLFRCFPGVMLAYLLSHV